MRRFDPGPRLQLLSRFSFRFNGLDSISTLCSSVLNRAELTSKPDKNRTVFWGPSIDGLSSLKKCTFLPFEKRRLTPTESSTNLTDPAVPQGVGCGTVPHIKFDHVFSADCSIPISRPFGTILRGAGGGSRAGVDWRQCADWA